MRQINFALIFGFALLTVCFTLENTDSITVNILPGLSTSLPLAVLLLVAGGLGALGAWSYARWNLFLNNVDEQSKIQQLEENQMLIKELKSDLNKSRSGLKVLPFMQLSKIAANYEDENSKAA